MRLGVQILLFLLVLTIVLVDSTNTNLSTKNMYESIRVETVSNQNVVNVMKAVAPELIEVGEAFAGYSIPGNVRVVLSRDKTGIDFGSSPGILIGNVFVKNEEEGVFGLSDEAYEFFEQKNVYGFLTNNYFYPDTVFEVKYDMGGSLEYDYSCATNRLLTEMWSVKDSRPYSLYQEDKDVEDGARPYILERHRDFYNRLE